PFGRQSSGRSQKSSAPGWRDGSRTMAGQGTDRSKTGRPGRKEQSSVKATSDESNSRLLTTSALLNRTGIPQTSSFAGSGGILPGRERNTFLRILKGDMKTCHD